MFLQVAAIYSGLNLKREDDYIETPLIVEKVRLIV